MTDYFLNKLIFDLQGPDGKDSWANRRDDIISNYELRPEFQKALREDDIGVLLPHVNPYLMRFFLLLLGNDDKKSIEILSQFQSDDDREKING